MKKFLITVIALSFASTAYGDYQSDYPDKETPIGADQIPISDSEDLNALSKPKVKNLLISDLTSYLQTALTFTVDTDDQTASEVVFTPEGTIEATNVQAAIQEVRDEAGGALTAESITDLNIVTPATGDYLPFYDVTGAVIGRTTIDNLQAVNQLYRKADRVTQRYEVTAATDSISAADLLTYKYITNQGASAEVEITLPDISYALLNVVMSEEVQILTLCPPSGETLDSDTITTLIADDCVSSPAEAGAKATVVRMKDASGDWIYSIDFSRGTWAEES